MKSGYRHWRMFIMKSLTYLFDVSVECVKFRMIVRIRV